MVGFTGATLLGDFITMAKCACPVSRSPPIALRYSLAIAFSGQPFKGHGRATVWEDFSGTVLLRLLGMLHAV